MEKTILVCTLIVCLTAIVITMMLIRQKNENALNMWEIIMDAVKKIIESFEYQEHLKSTKNEKTNGDISESDQS